jgi:phosphatidylglycerophosphatase A
MPPSEVPTNDRRADAAPILSRIVATAFFTGYIPWASGTFGSLAGLLVLLIPGAEQPIAMAMMLFIAIATGVPAAGAVARAEGNRLSRVAAVTKKAFQPGDHGAPDPSIVVIDEVVGMWITLFLVPKTIPAYLLGFLLFRAMDIVKPQPARAVERIPDGWGIMLDDIVAGLYANLALRVLLWVIRAILPAIAS